MQAARLILNRRGSVALCIPISRGPRRSQEACPAQTQLPIMESLSPESVWLQVTAKAIFFEVDIHKWQSEILLQLLGGTTSPLSLYTWEINTGLVP